MTYDANWATDEAHTTGAVLMFGAPQGTVLLRLVCP